MVLPSVLSIFDSGDLKSPDNLMLSPFPSFCQHSSISDHSDVFNMIKGDCTKVPIVSFQDCILDQHDDQSSEKIHSLSSDDISSSTRVPSNKNVICDVTLVSPPSSPVVNEPETDILRSLDDLDFDFDVTPGPENVCDENFRSFMTTDLDDALQVDNDNSDSDIFNDCVKNVNNDEHVHGKELFLKHLRLKRVATARASRPNRKRSYEESVSELSALDYANNNQTVNCVDCHKNVTSVIGSSNQCPHKTSTNSFSHSPHHIDNNNNESCNISIRAYNADVSHHQQSSTSSSPNTFHDLTSTVPCKSCSYSCVDWRQTSIYSTAKSPRIADVYTSPSTASNMRQQGQSTNSSSSFFAELEANIIRDKGRVSPSLILSESIKDYFEFDLMDTVQMEEDTDDLLDWLDSQDSSSHPHPLSIIGNSVVTDDTTSSTSSSSSTYSPQSSPGDLDSLLSPDTHSPSVLEMETFMDLKSYVPEENDLGNLSFSIKLENSHSGEILSKPHVRHLVLDDISDDVINSGFSEKIDTNKYDTRICDNENQRSESSRLKYCETFNGITQNENIENLRMLDMFGDENNAWFC